MRKLLQWSWWTGSVSRRIGVITVLTMALTAAVAAVSLRGLHTLNSELDRTVREQSQAAALVGAMLEESQRLSDSARLAAGAPTPEARDAALAQLEASKKALGERVDEISARLSNAPELQKALQEGFSSFVISAVKASRLIKAGRTADAERELLTAFDPQLLSYVLMTIRGISEHTERAVQAVAVTGHGAYNRTLGLLLPILVAMAAGMIVSHVLLRSTVIKPVQRVARAAEQLAQGTFDIDLTSTSRDECGDMLHAMASLRGQLASMIEAISSASSAVATTADSLADDNQDLSSRTNEQARAFREASQALEALNVMAHKSAEGARQVSNDMQQAFSSAQHGNSVILQAVATMQTSAEASRRIADTVGMIDEIAFKTNILALNAAVEAARAGEHGRSFGRSRSRSPRARTEERHGREGNRSADRQQRRRGNARQPARRRGGSCHGNHRAPGARCGRTHVGHQCGKPRTERARRTGHERNERDRLRDAAQRRHGVASGSFHRDIA